MLNLEGHTGLRGECVNQRTLGIQIQIYRYVLATPQVTHKTYLIRSAAPCRGFHAQARHPLRRHVRAYLREKETRL
jgi:hypothetical protein